MMRISILLASFTASAAAAPGGLAPKYGGMGRAAEGQGYNPSVLSKNYAAGRDEGAAHGYALATALDLLDPRVGCLGQIVTMTTTVTRPLVKSTTISAYLLAESSPIKELTTDTPSSSAGETTSTTTRSYPTKKPGSTTCSAGKTTTTTPSSSIKKPTASTPYASRETTSTPCSVGRATPSTTPVREPTSTPCSTTKTTTTPTSTARKLTSTPCPAGPTTSTSPTQEPASVCPATTKQTTSSTRYSAKETTKSTSSARESTTAYPTTTKESSTVLTTSASKEPTDVTSAYVIPEAMDPAPAPTHTPRPQLPERVQPIGPAVTLQRGDIPPGGECVPDVKLCVSDEVTGASGWKICDTQGKWQMADNCPPNHVCKADNVHGNPYCVPFGFQFPQ